MPLIVTTDTDPTSPTFGQSVTTGQEDVVDDSSAQRKAMIRFRATGLAKQEKYAEANYLLSTIGE